VELLIDQLPKYADLLQKAGVIGVLLIICGVLVYEVIRLRKLSVKTFAERDAYRLAATIYKRECDRANITVDLTQLLNLPVSLTL
jgi:hypothetical protein